MLQRERIEWSTPVSPPTLEVGELHVWKIPCRADQCDLHDQWTLLSQRERDKARRFHQERHRRRYIQAHAGLRRILSIYLGKRPQLIEFENGPAGKPAVEGGPEFNLTTSEDLALAAVCRDLAVGIDCEFLRSRSSLVAIARRMFTADDADQIAAAPQATRLETFSRAWTALEASVKADGRGLFRSRDVPPMPELEVLHFAPEPGYVAAIARSSLPPTSDWSTWRLD